jgi:hypothetical protein
MGCSSKALFILQHGNDLVGDLPRDGFPLLLWDIVHQKDVGVFLVEWQGIDVHHLVFTDLRVAIGLSRFFVLFFWKIFGHMWRCGSGPCGWSGHRRASRCSQWVLDGLFACSRSI